MSFHLNLPKIILIFLFSIIFLSCSSIKSSNPLIGKTSFENWKNSEYWKELYYINYDPNTQAAFWFTKIYKEEKFNLIIFASIYCDECISEIPVLARIVEATRLPEESLKFYGLDEYSSEPTNFYKKFRFDKTPAVFIEFADGKVTPVPKGSDWLESINKFLSEHRFR